MDIKWIGRIIGMALLTWTIPFAASLGFYDKSGKFVFSFTFLKAFLWVIYSTISGTVTNYK